MIGVILWSDPATEKAVIWCEDHGDLAFLSRADCRDLPNVFFDVGDVVEFDVVAQKNVRRVNRVTRLQQSVAKPLVDSLANTPQPKPQQPQVDVSDSAEIIPFRLNPAMRPLTAARPQERRRG
ncbi:hypothetical protein [Tateyamaria sp. ANG-S1]|uniref:hypothetical protein n=1 Tax=Tateyamaria sp. ANG-S1 TaxID=1577905 RepID=UPI00057D43CC|nr:hypothetical protein [Tateyamaria sp. ANG-S1]KIC49015.1 hypothetical protein RA29_15345 [Tateyamaria sp. ANG-S1]